MTIYGLLCKTIYGCCVRPYMVLFSVCAKKSFLVRISQVQDTMLEYVDVLANLCQRNVTVQAFVKGLVCLI